MVILTYRNGTSISSVLLKCVVMAVLSTTLAVTPLVCLRAAQAQNLPLGARFVTQRQVGRGIACRINGHQFGPLSYSARDVGRKGVPKLSPTDLSELHQIERYVHSPNLRFAFETGTFIVFNAMLGPCYGGAPGYQVLNGATCKASWAPTDGLGALPDCFNPPRPWVKNDGGRGSPNLWSRGTQY